MRCLYLFFLLSSFLIEKPIIASTSSSDPLQQARTAINLGKEAIENFDFTCHQAVLTTIVKIYAAFNNLSSKIAEDHSKFQLWIDQFSTYFKEDKNFELPKGGGVKTIHAISEIPIECSLSKCADFIRYLRQCNLPTDIFQPVLARLKAIKSRLIADRLIYEKSAYPQKSDIQSFNILISKINELTYDLEIYINYTYSDQYKNYSQKQNLNVLKCVGKVLVYENKSGTRELIGTSTGSVIYLDSNKTQQVIVTTAHFPVNFKKSASAALEIYFIPHTELNTSDFTFNTSYPFDFNAIQKYKAKKIHLPKGEFQFDDATKKTGPCTIGEDKIAFIQLIQESNEQDYMFFEVENQFNNAFFVAEHDTKSQYQKTYEKQSDVEFKMVGYSGGELSKIGVTIIDNMANPLRINEVLNFYYPLHEAHIHSNFPGTHGMSGAPLYHELENNIFIHGVFVGIFLQSSVSLFSKITEDDILAARKYMREEQKHAYQ